MAPIILERAPCHHGDQIIEVLHIQPPSFVGFTKGVEVEAWILSLEGGSDYVPMREL